MPRRPVLTRVAVAVNTLLAGLACSFALWDPLEIDDRATIKRATVQSTRSVIAAVDGNFRREVLALRRLVGRTDAGALPLPPDWELRSQVFLETHPAYLQLQWIDPDGRTTQPLTLDSGPATRGLDFDTHTDLKRLLDMASVTSGEAVMSSAFRLPDGVQAAGVMVPIRTAERVTGFVSGIFDIAAAFDLALHAPHDRGYSIAIEEGAQQIFRSMDNHQLLDAVWEHDADLNLPGVTWRIHVRPNPQTVQDVRSALPELAFVLTALLAFNLVVTMRFPRAAHPGPDAALGPHARSDESLRELPGYLQQLQDEERRRIGRELHDSTVQTLGAAAMGLDNARRLAAHDAAPRLRELLQASAELLDASIQELRTRSYLLHPPMLDELGLEYALPWFAEGFARRCGVAVTVKIQPDLGRLPRPIELALFRVAQEALTNVYRHSGSETAEIVLQRNPGSVLLEITDQGRGLAPDILTCEGGRSIGVGLSGLRERVRQLGGRLEIAAPEHGARISVVLPLISFATTPDRACRADKSLL